jgi:hypothetical protein
VSRGATRDPGLTPPAGLGACSCIFLMFELRRMPLLRRVSRQWLIPFSRMNVGNNGNSSSPPPQAFLTIDRTWLLCEVKDNSKVIADGHLRPCHAAGDRLALGTAVVLRGTEVTRADGGLRLVILHRPYLPCLLLGSILPMSYVVKIARFVVMWNRQSPARPHRCP